MVPPNFNFQSISLKKSQNPNRKMHLETSLCKHSFVQMIILIPGTIGKGSVERKHTSLTEFLLIMNDCFIQYKAQLVEYLIATQ